MKIQFKNFPIPFIYPSYSADDINTKSVNTNTSINIFESIKRGNLSDVKTFIKQDPKNLHVKYNSINGNESLLHYAVSHNQLEIAEYLISLYNRDHIELEQFKKKCIEYEHCPEIEQSSHEVYLLAEDSSPHGCCILS